MVEAVYTIPGFETRFLERLRDAVTAMPSGAAELYVEKKPSGGPLLPHFCITPSNRRSAIIKGAFMEGEGIGFSIGQGTSSEIYVSSQSEEKARRSEDEFFVICATVFTKHFSEKLIYSSHGTVIWSRIVLEIEGRKVRIGGHQIFWWLLPGRTTKQFSYEPYY